MPKNDHQFGNIGSMSWLLPVTKSHNSVFKLKESFGVGFQFLKNELKTHIWGVSGVRNHVVKTALKNNDF